MLIFLRRKAPLTAEDRKINRRIKHDWRKLDRYYRNHPEAAVDPNGDCSKCALLSCPCQNCDKNPKKEVENNGTRIRP